LQNNKVMNKEHWLDRLQNNKGANDRVEIASDHNCPQFLLEIMIRHDIEESVIEAVINNINCTDSLKELGKSRLETIKVDKQNNDAICAVPWTHIGIQQNGDFRICCQQIHSPYGKLHKEGQMANIQAVTIQEAVNLPEIKQLRIDMLKGTKNDLCKLCYKEESLGLKSKRQHMNQVYRDIDFTKTKLDGTIDQTDFPLRYIDIRFGNLCNLRCRYCGPTDSSLWYDEYGKFSNNDEIKFNFYGGKSYKLIPINNKYKVDTDDFEWYEKSEFWDQITKLIPYIDRYYFTGGEPTVNKIHFKLLEKIIEMGFHDKVELEYNSNMYAIPNKLFDLWKNFKNVGIGCSIDGIHDYAYYLRNPSTWEILESNLDKLGYGIEKNISGTIATTVSAFNVLNFLDLTLWLLEKKYTKIKLIPTYHMLEEPKHMSVQVLPIDTKLDIIKKYFDFYEMVERKYNKTLANRFRKEYKGILNFMLSQDKTALLPKLALSTKMVDESRGQKINEVIPWLAEILENHL